MGWRPLFPDHPEYNWWIHESEIEAGKNLPTPDYIKEFLGIKPDKEMSQYYEKVLISSGEVPEKNGKYRTDYDGVTRYRNGVWTYEQWSQSYDGFVEHKFTPTYWLKPIEGSPIDFAKWIDKNFFKSMVHGKYINREVVEGEGFKKYTIEELYDKFLEHGK